MRPWPVWPSWLEWYPITERLWVWFQWGHMPTLWLGPRSGCLRSLGTHGGNQWMLLSCTGISLSPFLSLKAMKKKKQPWGEDLKKMLGQNLYINLLASLPVRSSLLFCWFVNLPPYLPPIPRQENIICVSQQYQSDFPHDYLYRICLPFKNIFNYIYLIMPLHLS